MNHPWNTVAIPLAPLQRGTNTRFFIKKIKLILCSFIPIFLLFISACQPTERKVTPTFYHWQTNLNLNSTEQAALKQLATSRLYAKFFDVIWDGNQAVPTAEIYINPASFSDNLEIIPTIYITNETLVQVEENKITDLAKNIIQKVNNLAQQIPDFQFQELQIDCDWTLQTRTKYFQLLQLLKKEHPPLLLSATIRLHQIKYKNKTGIPPVQRGVLMFYNTGDLQQWESKNTILTLAEAKKYVTHLEGYDLPLDIALPIFNWGVVYREERLFKLINQLTATELKDTTRFTEITPNRFTVIKSTYLRGHYLYQNDQIRLENVTIKMLQASADLLAPRMNSDDFQVLFYHLDSTNLVQHPVVELQEICERFY